MLLGYMFDGRNIKLDLWANSHFKEDQLVELLWFSPGFSG